ncbi:hypothetical protein [Streptomyces sp. enrichment culture]|uniref:hypothetical protein n=1 Tax=Streptomyces sp. enrichment culture TaxID=1795815 RepID=UPI003F550F89
MNDKLMQVLVFAICVAGYVPLAMTGKATAEYVTLIGPVLAVVILKTHLGQQDETLTKIQEQTNGVLDRRIKDGVKAALAEREGTVTD